MATIKGHRLGQRPLIRPRWMRLRLIAVAKPIGSQVRSPVCRVLPGRPSRVALPLIIQRHPPRLSPMTVPLVTPRAPLSPTRATAPRASLPRS